MKVRFVVFLFLAVIALPLSAQAYIGPGAGFAVLGSTAVFLLTLLMAVVTVLFWPFQLLWRYVRGKGVRRNARTRRVVIVGLDGLEPTLVDRYMGEGQLPNMKRLAETGSYQRLGTTLPALSPVAWSTFQTGVNPGAHNIFDFLTRDKRYCLPQLSSTDTAERPRRNRLLRLLFGEKEATIRLLRRAEPFWKILGRKGIFSNIIRVPISYPPEKTFGNVLSAMCTPDLRGSQGSFTLFTTRKLSAAQVTSGEFRSVERRGNIVQGDIIGPAHPTDAKAPPLQLAFTLTLSPDGTRGTLNVAGRSYSLNVGEFSDWIELPFSYGRRKIVKGIARCCLRETTPDISLYLSPLNVSPDEPCLPIAYPLIFARWIARQIGQFGTLGLMEDTWGRNEHALDDEAFLAQTWLTHEERERMFFEVLERTTEGVCVCVFDASDRIQHMFWRYLDDAHPSPREPDPKFLDTIPEMYRRMDALVGRTIDQLREDDVLLVMSDHGFSSFRRTINLNRWLIQEGYLALKPAVAGSTALPGIPEIDWSRTKAFAVGLTGIYLNRKGRERYGIVEDSAVRALKTEIGHKLEQLRDPQSSDAPIRRVYDAAKEYRGLYTDEAPDLIIGFAPGYRVSWECVTGGVEPEIFGDNLKAWSGDHHIDPVLVPGILFANRKVRKESPNIIDLAPTVLDLFAVKVPSHMEGQVIL